MLKPAIGSRLCAGARAGSARRRPGAPRPRFWAGRTRSEVRQHDDVHQRAEQARKAFVAILAERACMKHGEHRADDAFGDYLRWFAPGARRKTTLIDDVRESVEHLRAPFEHARARSERLDEHEPGECRLFVEEHEQFTQTRTDALVPSALSLVALLDVAPHLGHRLLERR